MLAFIVSIATFIIASELSSIKEQLTRLADCAELEEKRRKKK